MEKTGKGDGKMDKRDIKKMTVKGIKARSYVISVRYPS